MMSMSVLQFGSRRAMVAAAAGVVLATIASCGTPSASPVVTTEPPSAPASSEAHASGSEHPTSAPEPPGGGIPGHDHGELSVTVLFDPTGFHVAGQVAAGSMVTVYNETTTDVTISASDGSFDVRAPALSLFAFEAPDEPGTYPFSSRHSPSFTGVLVVG